ncbi:MAG: hypothetical protein LUI02_04380 [Clostridiales bacterium]|nr:hypothetical protein [Clostridiales bacterium]
MKKIILAGLAALALLAAGCKVHEFPHVPEVEPMYLRLSFETDMTYWNHTFDGDDVTEEGLGETYDNLLDEGVVRYVIRTYPITGGDVSQSCEQEFTFTKTIGNASGDYDFETPLDIEPGDYMLMVWSDIVQKSGDGRMYDCGSFTDISLTGEHRGNTDYRDAFRGSDRIYVPGDIMEHVADTIDIVMQRPLAKFEFITTDLGEFITTEQARIDAKMQSVSSDASERVAGNVNLDEYRVVVSYVGFMPSSFSLFTDKPVDSTTGVRFESGVERLSATEATAGFDYVFVDGEDTSVSVQIGLYDGDGTQLSLTNPIKVPLSRSRHTVVRGEFLTSEASGGIGIDHEYDGDYVLTIP